MDANFREQAEKDRIEWAIHDKEDEKYQKKMTQKKAKMDYDGPSEKELKNAAYQAEMDDMAAPKSKGKKSAWKK